MGPSSEAETYSDRNLALVRNTLSIFAKHSADRRKEGDCQGALYWAFKLIDPPHYITGSMRKTVSLCEMHGTFTISSLDGYWEGTWSGMHADNRSVTFKYRGQGFGGYDGMALSMDLQRHPPGAAQPEIISGYIVDEEP